MMFLLFLQYMTYTPYSNIGCGLFYYDYSNGTKKHDGVLSSGINEKKSFYYVAPQISFIKRQAGFLDGIMYVSAGIGYVNYRSWRIIIQHVRQWEAIWGLLMNMLLTPAWELGWV